MRVVFLYRTEEGLQKEATRVAKFFAQDLRTSVNVEIKKYGFGEWLDSQEHYEKEDLHDKYPMQFEFMG